eukprot:415674_1
MSNLQPALPNSADFCATILIGICVIIMCIVFVDLIKSFYCDNQKIASIIKYFSLATLFFYFIMFISIFIGFINILCTYHQPESGLSYISTRIGILSWFLAQYLMLATYAARIHGTFRHSFLKFSNKVMKLLQCLVISLGLSGTATAAFILFKLYRLRDIGAIYTGTNFVILAILLMFLFIKRIDKVMLAKFERRQFIDNDMVLKMIDIQFIDLFVKNALLISFSICSSFIGFAGSIIAPKFYPDNRYPIFGYLAMVLSSTVNVIAMHLLYQFNTRKYQTICYCFHLLCKSCKVYMIIKTHKWKDAQQKHQFSQSMTVLRPETSRERCNSKTDTITMEVQL